MASRTTIGQVSPGITFSDWIAGTILNEMRPYNVMKPFFRPVEHVTWEVWKVKAAPVRLPWTWSRMI